MLWLLLILINASFVEPIIGRTVPTLRVSPLDNSPLFVVPTGQNVGLPLPSCETACLDHFTGVLHMLFSPGSLAKSRDTVCAKYRLGEECMRPLTHCSDSLFPLMTSGIRYLCDEQAQAFEVLLDCVDMNTAIIKRECELQCNPESLVAGLAVKDTVMQTLDQPLGTEGVNMKQIIEPHLGRIAFSEGCRIGQCLLNCYKTKFNMMCEGTAGSLIMEMLSRPLSVENEAPLSTQVLSTFFNGFLPRTCDFLSDKKSMRIDPELDAEIKRMYANRRKPTVADFQSFAEPVKQPDPYNILQKTFEGQQSPLENRNLLKLSSKQFEPEPFIAVYEMELQPIELPIEDMILSSGSGEEGSTI